MMLSPPQSIVCLNKLADGSIDRLEMRCVSEVSRTEPCTFSQLLSAIQRGRYRCVCVCTGSGTPASCLGVACGASERMCLQRNYRSVEWLADVEWTSQAPWGATSVLHFCCKIQFLRELS